MVKHTLEISQRPARLFLRRNQLILDIAGEERQFACEDIGVLILQNPAISLSSALLNSLLESGAVVVVCNEKHLPSGLLLPTITHTELVPRLMSQLDTGQPARKQTWKAIIQAKIHAQAREVEPPARTALLRLAQSVRSGDPDNNEAQAARLYWPSMFPDRYAAKDKRDPESESFFNYALNYGYAIIRASVARALVSAGLHPALGVFHHRRDNPFCLADDVMEPFRPLVDRTVKKLLQEGPIPERETLEPKHRRALLELLNTRVTFAETSGPFMAVLPRYIASFYRLLIREDDTLETPSF